MFKVSSREMYTPWYWFRPSAISDSRRQCFPRFSWLLRNFPDTTRDPKEKLNNQTLRSTRVVTENCYGVLKGRWGLIYKETEMKKFNLKCVVMSCTMLHNPPRAGMGSKSVINTSNLNFGFSFALMFLVSFSEKIKLF